MVTQHTQYFGKHFSKVLKKLSHPPVKEFNFPFTITRCIYLHKNSRVKKKILPLTPKKKNSISTCQKKNFYFIFFSQNKPEIKKHRAGHPSSLRLKFLRTARLCEGLAIHNPESPSGRHGNSSPGHHIGTPCRSWTCVYVCVPDAASKQ